MAIVSLAFFYPDNFAGNSLRQPDMVQGAANGHEGQLWEQATGEKALWTNSLFGGMPTFQISPSYPSNSLFSWFNSAYGLWLPSPSNLMFMMMMGFMLFMLALGKRWYYALVGAVAWGLSSYFIIIIGAGHIWKFLALSYIPPTIGGLVLLYRSRRIAGTAMTAFFAMMQLAANHPQMSYYFGMVMVLVAAAYLVDAIRRHTVRDWFAGSALAVAAGALAIGANAPSLYNTFEYSHHTKRAQSELTVPSPQAADNTSERPTGGLPKNDIVGWSYGTDELFTFIVPNIKGGASARPQAGQNVLASLAELDGAEAFPQNSPTGFVLSCLPQYFNDSEGTNGPVYAGVIMAALFLLGCFIVRGPLKWAMVAATAISLLLSLGYNAMWLTDWMIYHFPLYNKFRAVESILVVVEFAVPLLGVLALSEFIEAGKDAWRKYSKALTVSFSFPAAVAFLALVAPAVFGNPVSARDLDNPNIQYLQMQVAQAYAMQGASRDEVSAALYEYSLSHPVTFEAVKTLRLGMVRADGLRSLLFLALAFAVLAWYGHGRLRRPVAIGAIGLFVLADLYSVDKRYVNHASFGPSADSAQGIEPDAVDRAIMADTTGHYRVLDIPGFSDARRSYFHKMIGGYHAAKLNRYEDIINNKLLPVLSGDTTAAADDGYAVVDMLNTRYIITGDRQTPLLINPGAMGNAWLVDSIVWVDSAREEMDAIGADLDLRHTAVASRDFAGVLPDASPAAPGDTVVMTYYSPNTLRYRANVAGGGVCVFSEVYFPWGWEATVDGQEVPIARVNYILRAIALPAGTHEITMIFRPKSVKVTSTVAYACVSLIYLLLLAGVFVEGRRWRLF